MDTKTLNKLSDFLNKDFQNSSHNKERYSFIKGVFQKSISGDLYSSADSGYNFPESRAEMILSLIEATEIIKKMEARMLPDDAKEAHMVCKATYDSLVEILFSMD